MESRLLRQVRLAVCLLQTWLGNMAASNPELDELRYASEESRRKATDPAIKNKTSLIEDISAFIYIATELKEIISHICPFQEDALQKISLHFERECTLLHGLLDELVKMASHKEEAEKLYLVRSKSSYDQIIKAQTVPLSQENQKTLFEKVLASGFLGPKINTHLADDQSKLAEAQLKIQELEEQLRDKSAAFTMIAEARNKIIREQKAEIDALKAQIRAPSSPSASSPPAGRKSNIPGAAVDPALTPRISFSTDERPAVDFKDMQKNARKWLAKYNLQTSIAGLVHERTITIRTKLLERRAHKVGEVFFANLPLLSTDEAAELAALFGALWASVAVLANDRSDLTDNDFYTRISADYNSFPTIILDKEFNSTTTTPILWALKKMTRLI